jgi:hypothetical protein
MWDILICFIRFICGLGAFLSRGSTRFILVSIILVSRKEYLGFLGGLRYYYIVVVLVD